MPSVDDIKTLIRIHNHRLQNLKEKQAIYGISVDSSVVIEITEIEKRIEKLQAELEQMQSGVKGISINVTRNSVPKKQLSRLENGQLYLGRFEIMGFYGRGGVSDVHTAWDTKNDLKVIIKRFVIEQESTRPEFYIGREAKIIQKLSEKKISGLVKTLDIIPSSDEICLVQENIQGKNLHTYIKHDLRNLRKDIDLRKVLNIAIKLTETLERLHKYQIAHCDVKPLNIIIDQFGYPTLIDLGAARIINIPIPFEEVFVSIPYSPRELFTGEAIDGRVDIYSLGMTLMHMLVGLPRIDNTENITRHPDELTKSPSDEDIRNYIKFCLWEIEPKTLRPIVDCALAQHPKDRYTDMGDLRDALLRELKNVP